ncbi:formylmethanofuran dehydrogenase subunit C [Candidatus Bathyarchaeota archaeon]|nr:formylmethanofuran dehydrogenase subunit C [Candidatus Bathyarchaeota archaeon]
MGLVLELKRPLKSPVHLDVLSTDRLAGIGAREVADLDVWEGNRKVKIRTLFNIRGEADTDLQVATLTVVGNLSATRRIGYKMTAGNLYIRGEGGMYIGESMRGGRIVVEGNAGSWLGSGMKSGMIEVRGNAGDFIGAASRGSRKGMDGGSILVRGSGGSNVGSFMRSGTIRILGDAEMFLGVHMQGGTIHVEGNCTGRAGAHMTGGKIVVSGYLPNPLPSFSFEEIREQTRIENEAIRGPFYVFSGDNNIDGDGRLFVSIGRNPQMRWCERFLEE